MEKWKCPCQVLCCKSSTQLTSAARSQRHGHCLQAIEELNIKPKFWKDLLTDEAFTRKDIIHLQDPLNLQVRESLNSVKQTELHRVQLGWLGCLELRALLHAGYCITTWDSALELAICWTRLF